MTTWRVQAPGDLVYVREGAPVFDDADAAATLADGGSEALFRVQGAELGVIVATDWKVHAVSVFLSRRMKLVWVDSYWCSRIS